MLPCRSLPLTAVTLILLGTAASRPAVALGRQGWREPPPQVEMELLLVRAPWADPETREHVAWHWVVPLGVPSTDLLRDAEYCELLSRYTGLRLRTEELVLHHAAQLPAGRNAGTTYPTDAAAPTFAATIEVVDRTERDGVAIAEVSFWVEGGYKTRRRIDIATGQSYLVCIAGSDALYGLVVTATFDATK